MIGVNKVSRYVIAANRCIKVDQKNRQAGKEAYHIQVSAAFTAIFQFPHGTLLYMFVYITHHVFFCILLQQNAKADTGF